MKKTVYPEWKVVAWRFGRTFFATFIVTFGLGLVGANDINAIQVLVISSASAGLVAIGKALRGDDVKGLITKLPI